MTRDEERTSEKERESREGAFSWFWRLAIDSRAVGGIEVGVRVDEGEENRMCVCVCVCV